MSKEDEGLRLHSGRVVMMSENEGVREESVEELHACVFELQQKLAISEQAINHRNEELQAIREALESAKSEADSDVELVREEEKQKRIELEHDFRETIKSWEQQNQVLQKSLEECSAELKNQEIKLKLIRLQGLEKVRQGFDREREVYLERIQKLEKELAAEKELRSSGLATIVSAVPGSGTGGAPSPSPSHCADGGELSSVSVKEPVGKRMSVVSGSELGSVETGVAREASPTTVIPLKVLETSPASKLSGGSIDDSSRDLGDKISDSKGGAPVSVGRDSTSLTAKVHGRCPHLLQA